MNSYTSSNIVERLYSLVERNNTLFSVTIELLTKCNWRCSHCYIPRHSSDGLSKDIIFDIFEQLRALGTFEIVLTGGEIFCRDDIIDIIERARQMFFKVTLLTNVSLMDEDIISRLSKLHLYNISCTIFSLNNNIHDSITGVPGSLKKVLNNAMLIKKYGIPLEIKTIIMKENYNSYKELKRYCNENGFQYKVDAEVFSRNNGDSTPQQLRMSEEQLQEVLVDIDTLRGFNVHKHSADELICPITKYSISIDSNGNVYPCNKYFYKIGNIYNNSLSDIWNNNPTLDILRDLRWRDLPQCSKCENNKYCSRCPGVALLENGDLLGKSSLACQFANTRCKLYST